ncbi:Asp23/Gls24 family envelope stress response protein [Deinococcus irradiatisoli]|uniref:Asp23/Gls24 family envelope stress response protein n=1 Tax=Deinococcus irradiatisoli TaxID=2202254 RepID=A0A2Z3JG01_9DEIO|nr:Asp23/Gls24 family envelope stress response protein [Deinococcus irradiatisoli]AWN22906.1 Asp23/Gls24 family envelope stress response protein [Deinococcus irradiatisoli]
MELEISKNVLTDIATSTLERIPGLMIAAAAARPGNLGTSLSGSLGSLSAGESPLARRPKALKITREGQQVSLEVGVNIEYGKNLQALSQQAQRALQENIELMTGLKVKAVNVTVQGLTLPSNAPAGSP